MRILYIHTSNIWGGATVALYRILLAMKNRGHDVYVVTNKSDGPFLEKLDSVGIKHFEHRLSLTIYPKVKNPLKWCWRTLRLLYRIHDEKKFISKVIDIVKPDIVHTNVGPFSQAYDICKKKSVPHVWHQREYQDLDFDMHFFPSWKVFNRKIKSMTSYNISITKGIFNYRKLRVNRDIVIYDGVFSKQQILNLELNVNKENYILFAGRIEEAKCPFDLLVAFFHFHKDFPNVRLLFAGSFIEENSYYQKCKQYIESMNLSDFVSFLGPRMDIYDLMSKALMLVVPSRFEGFGFITAEAMLNRCVVIGRNTAGTKEQFDNGLKYSGKEIAYRFDNNSQLFECMVRAIESDNGEMVEAAYKSVVHLYNVEDNVLKLEEYYKKILKLVDNSL